ncbi:ATP-binding protein [Streptomyces sp. NBC_01264]|uniref:ATP-binding protein n=1 Tax=Streptomyces sp. NBC_01264 TaxID=2903804 RepID=UPI00224D2CB1|nr:NB-ARC domain-containing protein [Streptomyces sp. NBC_01264]MCX4776131.1 regulator [Streptomyces sp. NBC_01264]
MIGNLPEPSSSLIGRAPERAALVAALAEQRLTTVTGAGGVGKSSLALHAVGAGEDTDVLIGWAHLWPLQDEKRLVATLADAVGFSDHQHREPLAGLSEWMSGRRTLLVLDSCEHLTTAVRSVVADLLTACPELRVLVTSREPLGIAGEGVLRLGPLGESDSMELLRERAAAAGSSWHGPEAEASAVDVCRLLDGLPLALELAAAQLAGTSPQRLADQLRAHAGAELLHTRKPVQPARHRSLWTAMGWSHELCEPKERLLWSRLTVFRGQFDATAARAVCADRRLPAADVTSALEGLVRKSVLTRVESGFRLLEPLREYGRMWLVELGELDDAADRHATHFAALAARAEEDWLGPGQVDAYARVEEAHTDLCAALDHLLITFPGRALALMGRLGFFWACTGHLQEARGYLERCLDRAVEPDGPEHTQALWALGTTRLLQGDHAGAFALASRCSEAADPALDPEGSLRAAYLSGLVHLMSGDPHQAHATVRRALDDVPADPFFSQARLFCRLVAVFALTGLGDLAEAEKKAESLREKCALIGEYWTRSYTEYQLSLIALLQIRPALAAERAHAMLLSKRKIGDSFGVALGLDLLAAAVALQGEADRAARIYAAGLLHWRAVGHPQRGTPELAPIREQCEESLRARLGADGFTRILQDAEREEPAELLARILGEDEAGRHR